MVMIGTVIEGTLRIEELIPAFMAELAWRDPVEADRIADKYTDALQSLDNDDTCTFVDVDTVAMAGVAELIEALDNVAPEGYYFGSHPNDAAAFGYYPILLREES